MAEKEKSEAEIAFDEMAEIAPEDITEEGEEDEVEEGGEGHQTLEQGLASPNLSDMAIADRRLFPDTGHKHLNMIQVSRVWPDSYVPFQAILVKDLLRQNPKMRVAEAIALVSTSQSIAIDGEGRLDTLAALGSAQAIEQKDELKKLGGI